MTQGGSGGKPDAIVDSITSSVLRSVPWLTEPVIESIREISDHRRLTRIQGIFEQLIANLADFKSELSELYVKTPGFKSILSQVVRMAADEPLEEKRAIYTVFLTDAIVSPLESTERQLRLVNILRELKTDHVRLLGALAEIPASQAPHAQSPLQMLQSRVPDIPRDRLEGLLRQMTDLDIIGITDWSAAVPGGPEEVRKSMTAIGQRLIQLVAEIKRPK